MSAPVSPSVMLGLIAKEQDRRKASAKLYEFVKQAWHVMEPGVPFVPSWHIEEICEHLEAVSSGDIHRLLVNIPPRHSKSTIVSVAWCAWEWIAQPEQKFLAASYSGSLSIRDNLKARRLIQSPWYQERWGHMFELSGDQNAKQRFENDKTGYRLATSVGGTATGEGGSRLILDDPHGAQDAQSETMRQTALDWFDMVWSTRLNNPKTDAMVTVMQRLHEKDISGHILEDIGGWEHVCIPAEWDGKKRRTVLGPYDACTVWGVFTHKGIHQAMLLDAWDEALGYPDLRTKVIEDWTSMYGADPGPKAGMPTKGRRPDRVLVEAKASGQSLLQDLRLAKVPAVGYNPGNADKVSRAHQAAPTLELGLLWIPESNKNPGQPVSWAQSFLKQIAKFPVAEHDDYVDTFTQAVIFLKNDGWFELPQARDVDEHRLASKEKVNPYAA